MGFYEREILPRAIDIALSGRELRRLRGAAAEGLDGRIVEIGFGTGANVPFLPSAVEHLWAVDPAVTGRKLAASRIAASEVEVEHIGLDGAAIPLPDGSADHALCTWTLCTIPDAGGALSEIRRVLRPGGAFHFVEHGRSPRPSVARWQDRLTPLWGRVAGGCHLDRDIEALVRDSGLVLEELDHPAVRGPQLFTYMFAGRAVKPAS